MTSDETRVIDGRAGRPRSVVGWLASAVLTLAQAMAITWGTLAIFYLGRLDTTLPFADLRRPSRINVAARAAHDAADFSGRIRASLPSGGP